MENKPEGEPIPFKFIKVKKMKTKSVGFVVRRFYIDNYNFLQISSSDKLIHMKIKLHAENRMRMIGTITKSTRTFDIKRKRATHIHRIMDSYGFNDFVMRYGYTFDSIRLSDDGGNSTTRCDTLSSYADGVADKNTHCGIRSSTSSNRSGRLSRALGKRNPCSTNWSLRLRSPMYWPCNCGTATWLSSMTNKKSSGK